MENEYMKRGYLLPEGCKDLTPFAKPNRKLEALSQYLSKALAAKVSTPLPPIAKQVFISPPMTVKKLAALLEQKPFRIICDLVQLGIWVTVESVIDFNASSAVARMHGFEAIKAG